MKKRVLTAITLFCCWACPQNILADSDITSSITNPSFEGNDTNGWECKELVTQSNDKSGIKNGTYYLEKWVDRGKDVGNASLQQTVTLNNGKYTLKAGAFNLDQDAVSTPQTGAVLFANDTQVEVTAAKDYSIVFTVIEGEATIGFNAVNASGNWIGCDNFRLTAHDVVLADLTAELSRRIAKAQTLLEGKLQQPVRTALENVVTTAESLLNATDESQFTATAKTLATAMEDATHSATLYETLQTTIEEALAAFDEEEEMGVAAFDSAIKTAQAMMENYTASDEELADAAVSIEKATLTFFIANASGSAPEVTTYPYIARGSDRAYGRSTVDGTRIMEKGFCWSTHPNPTVLDHRSTEYISHNGEMYRITGLEPSTVYYVRAYAMTRTYAVGYGEIQKVITLPKGKITYQYNYGGPEDCNKRIWNALVDAVDNYWNRLTSISGLHVNVNYGSGTPTADCSYGGYMRVGPNPSYQRTGTIMHEMGHAIGVGTHWVWNKNSPLRATRNSGTWLGDRTTAVIRFLDNNEESVLTGDGTHMWPYGVNGAHEDLGTEALYIANALITQALGEDGLPPTGGFATPTYTFESEENVKYYIKNEDSKYGLNTAYLGMNKNGYLRWVEANGSTAISNDTLAWYITFDPVSCYYTLKNAATGEYLSYSAANSNNGMTLEKKTPGANEKFQLMMARIDTNMGSGIYSHTSRGYWIIHPERNMSPQCMAANTRNRIATEAFSLENTATQQRWVILTEEEVSSFDLEGMVLTDIRVNGTTLVGFSYDVHDYTYEVAPDADPSSISITATPSKKFDGTVNVTLPNSIPGKATIEAVSENGSVTYTLNLAQNYAYQWDGDGATGANSTPNTFGWSVTPTSLWASVNSTMNRNKYMDPEAYSGYTLNGAPYNIKRVLWIRYKNNEEFRYAFSGLEAGKSYDFSFTYGWETNGVAPNLTVGIYTKDSELVKEERVATVEEMGKLLTAGFTFTTPQDMVASDYYLSFKNDGNDNCVVIIGDIMVCDQKETSILEHEWKALHITSQNNGIVVSTDVSTALYIYTYQGSIVHKQDICPGSTFIPLQKGIYIVNHQKIIVR